VVGPQEDPRDREIRNLTEENQALRERVALMSRLGQQVTASLDSVTVLQGVIDAACELTKARYGALGVFNQSGRVAQFITHGLSEEERRRIGNLPKGLGILGHLQHLQQPLRLADLAKHPRSVGFPENHPAMKSFLGAPIRLGDEPLGNIYLTEKQGAAEFTPEDEAMLVLFSAQAALAIHNARLHEQVVGDRLALKEEQERLRALVETTPVGVFLFDADQRLILANREGQRLRGVPLEPGMSLAELQLGAGLTYSNGTPLLPEDLPSARALRGERTSAQELRLATEERSIPVLVSSTPVPGPDGAPVAAITVIQDMTPVEELERLRTEFLGMVSHELKTPLTAIKGSAATVLGSKRPFSPEETRELFEIVEEQADRLRDLVDNLLDMTRIEAGRLSVSPEDADLRAIVNEVKAQFAATAGEHTLQVDVASDTPLVKADRRRTAQVLSNLLSNAAKFSPAASTIALTVQRDSTTHVKVSVRDRGQGIPKERQGLLFRKFSQVHDDGRTKGIGTGLGLAISKGIVEALGGRIWAESEGEGHGSVFSFTVPASTEVPAPTPSVGGPQRPDAAKVHRTGQKTRVLAVDDEPQVIRYVQRTLEEGGYHAIVTSDPQQVTKLVELEEPDLVLLDVRLPGVTGYDLLARIREFSGVPVIFLTANTQSEDLVRGLKLGADDYVAKPFSPSELLARIEAVLRRRVMSDTLEVKPPFVLKDLAIQFTERAVTMAGKTVQLTATEYKLLYELASHAGIVLTHDQILQRVWGEEYSGATELLRSVVRNLRKKLGDDARNPEYVLTEPQVGYRMPRPAKP
jgi:DNA-binding response OmpR family regulator/signal transduction histidine kinase